MASSIIVARIGGPDVVGTLAFGMAFVAVFQFVTDLGIGTAQQKMVSSTDDIKDFISTYAILKIATSIIFLLVIVSYYYLQINLFNNKEIGKREIKIVIFIYIAIYFIDSLSYIFRMNFIARTERAKVEIPTFLQTTLDKIVRIILVSIGFGAIALATSSLIFVILVIPVNIYLFKNYKFGKFRKDLIKKYVAISIPVILIMFAQQWSENIDKIMLREMHGTYELGLYMAAISLSVPVKLLGSSVSTILFPSFSSLIYQNKLSEISALIIRYRKYLISICLPFIIIIILFSSQIVMFLFGNKYLPTIKYFPFVIFTLFVYIYTLPNINLAYANGLFKQIALISLLILGFQSGLIYLLSGKEGLNLKGLGTAISLLIINMILYIIYELVVKKLLELKTELVIYLTAIIQIIGGLIAMTILTKKTLFIQISVPILYLLMIFLFEWKSKVLTKNDIKFIVSLMNIKPLILYAKNEMKQL